MCVFCFVLFICFVVVVFFRSTAELLIEVAALSSRGVLTAGQPVQALTHIALDVH